MRSKIIALVLISLFISCQEDRSNSKTFDLNNMPPSDTLVTAEGVVYGDSLQDEIDPTILPLGFN